MDAPDSDRVNHEASHAVAWWLTCVDYEPLDGDEFKGLTIDPGSNDLGHFTPVDHRPLVGGRGRVLDEDRPSVDCLVITGLAGAVSDEINGRPCEPSRSDRKLVRLWLEQFYPNSDAKVDREIADYWIRTKQLLEEDDTQRLVAAVARALLEHGRLIPLSSSV